VSAIFREGLATGDASFEEACPDWAEWDSSHLAICRFVALAHDEVVGWAALAPVSERCVYGGVAEVSVYVAAGARRIGVGSALLAALVAASERDGLWTLQAGVFPENEASIVLHKKHGFRVVGTRERLGQLHGVWRDVVLLERRSPHVD
jgi:phosphinothricin acetyltransferase